MIHSFTPSGVEHTKAIGEIVTTGIVIHSFTPSGVEHPSTLAAFGPQRSGDSFVYAVRR